MMWILRRCKLAGKLGCVALSGLVAMAALWATAVFSQDVALQGAVAAAGGLLFLFVLYSVYRNISYGGTSAQGHGQGGAWRSDPPHHSQQQG